MDQKTIYVYTTVNPFNVVAFFSNGFAMKITFILERNFLWHLFSKGPQQNPLPLLEIFIS